MILIPILFRQVSIRFTDIACFYRYWMGEWPFISLLSWCRSMGIKGPIAEILPCAICGYCSAL